MTTKYVKIQTGFIRLDQFLKFTGAAQTGGHAKELVKEGFVSLNGEICAQRGKKLFAGDKIVIEDQTFFVE